MKKLLSSLLIIATLLIPSGPILAAHRFIHIGTYTTPVGGIALVGHIGAAQSSGSGNVTTGSLDTTGANLLVAVVTNYSAGPATGISDSRSNTWTGLTLKTNSTELVTVRIYYSYTTNVGSGQTFSTTGGSGTYPSVEVMAFSGTVGSTLDVQNGTTGGASPVSTGNVTPGANGEVIVSGLGANFATSLSAITSGFTNYDLASASGSAFFLSGAYYIQPTAGAQGCTFTWTSSSGSNNGAAVIGAFK